MSPDLLLAERDVEPAGRVVNGTVAGEAVYLQWSFE